MLKKSERYNFGNRPDNILGLKIDLQFDEDTKIAYGTEVTIPTDIQGHHLDQIHPGIFATLLDEIMAYINRSMNLNANIAELNIRYLQNAKIEENLHLRGYFVKKNKRIIENRAEIENDIGKIVARAKGKYIEVDPLS